MISVRVLDRDNRPVDAIAVKIVSTYFKIPRLPQQISKASRSLNYIPMNIMCSLMESYLKGVIWVAMVIPCF